VGPDHGRYLVASITTNTLLPNGGSGRANPLPQECWGRRGNLAQEVRQRLDALRRRVAQNREAADLPRLAPAPA